MEFNSDILIPKLKEHIEQSDQHKFQLVDFDEENISLKNTIGEIIFDASEMLQFSINKLENEVFKNSNLKIEYERTTGEIEKFQNVTGKILKRLMDLTYKAATTYVVWQAEYEKALVWLQNAENRFKVAEKALDKAIRELDNARYELRRKQNNASESKSGILGSIAEGVGISNAKTRVKRAEYNNKQCQEEKRNAEINLQNAEQRVRCTSEAVLYATSATEKTPLAREIGEQIKELQNKTLNLSEQTKTIFKETDYKLNTKQDIVTIMRDFHKKASDSKEYADNNIISTQNAIETSVSLLINATDETENKIKKLIQFSQ